MNRFCENCTGERREECLTIRSEFREQMKGLTQEAIELGQTFNSDNLNTLAATQSVQREKGAAVGITAARALTDIGCILDKDERREMIVEEVSSALTSFAYEQATRANSRPNRFNRVRGALRSVGNKLGWTPAGIKS